MSATVECPRCRAQARARAKFCGSCGYPLEGAGRSADVPAGRGGERRAPAGEGASEARSGERRGPAAQRGAAAGPSVAREGSRAVFRVAIDPEEVTVTPGGDPVPVTVRVYNLSDVIEQFAIKVVDNRAGLTAAPQELRLLPNTDDAVAIVVRIPGERFVAAGTYAAHVEVLSHAVHSVVAVESLQVVVPEAGGQVTLDMKPGVVRGARGGKVWLAVKNPRNVPLRATLRGTDPEGVLGFDFRPATLEIPAGGSATAEARIAAPRRPLVGHERSRQFTIDLAAGDRTTSVVGRLVQSPALTSGRRAALRAALTLAGGLALIAGAFGTWTTAPVERRGIAWPVPEHEAATGAWMALVFGGGIPLPPVADYVPVALVSAGLGAITLGALAMFGLVGRRGLLTLAPAALALALLAGFFGGLAITGPVALGGGALLCLAGALVAFAGGMFGQR